MFGITSTGHLSIYLTHALWTIGLWHAGDSHAWAGGVWRGSGQGQGQGPSGLFGNGTCPLKTTAHVTDAYTQHLAHLEEIRNVLVVPCVSLQVVLAISDRRHHLFGTGTKHILVGCTSNLQVWGQVTSMIHSHTSGLPWQVHCRWPAPA